MKKELNETSYTGGRISAAWSINDNWDLLLAHQTQDIDSDGVERALELQRALSGAASAAGAWLPDAV